MSEIAERFEQASLRLEKAVSLAMCSDWLALSEDAEEMLEEFGQVIRDTGIEFTIRGCAEESEDDADSAEEGPDEIAQRLFLAGFSGIFALFSQPVMKKREGSKFVSFSWGYYQSRWFYEPTLDKCALSALDWAENKQKLVFDGETEDGE